MKLRNLPAAMVATLCLFTAPTLFAAPFLNRATPSTTRPAKVHTISFQIRNSSAEVITLQAGDKQFTLKSGETASVKLPLGQALISQTVTAHFGAGALMATVNQDLQGNTLVFN